MKIEFDEAKNQKNIAERGISFELAVYFDLATAKIWPDTRYDYCEARFIVLGYILWFLRYAVICSVLSVLEKRINER